MSNRFYDFDTQFISGAVAKSSEVNTQFSGVATGFETAQLELNRAIKFPEAEDSTDQVISQAPAARHGYMLGFDLSGNLRAGNSFLIDWDMAGFRLRNLPTAIETDEPVTYGQLTAYSTDLVTGMPPIAAQSGALVTDGSSVSWDPNSVIPSVTSVAPSSEIVYDGTVVRWRLNGHNLVFDPNGTQGTTYWDTNLANVNDHLGYYFRNSGVLSAVTDTHEPQTTGHIAVGSGVVLVGAATIDTTGVSAGTISLLLSYYDGSHVIISSTTVSVPITTAEARYVVTGTTPGSTVYAALRVIETAIDATAAGLKVRDMKVEHGSYATPFNDDNTVAIITAAKASNPFGAGFASPSITLGDTSATTAALNLRSKDGSQAYDARILSTGGTNGTVGKAALTITAASVASTGPLGYASEYDAGNSGATKTIDFLNGSRQKLTLTADCTVTISSPPVVGHYQIKVIQDSTPRLITWSGFSSGNCAANTIPPLAQSNGGVSFIQMYWDGSVWWVSGNAWDA